MIIAYAIMLIIAAQLAYFTLFLIGDLSSDLARESILTRLAYRLLSPVGTSGFGCFALLLPGIGLVRIGRFGPYPKIVITVLVLWIALVCSGWIWTRTIDGVSERFGKGTVLSAMAEDELGWHGLMIYDVNDITWKAISVEPGLLEYCAILQYYTWMRIPVYQMNDCFSIIVSEARFVPGESDASARLNDRVFSARGTIYDQTTIQGLKWEAGALTLTLNPYFPLTGLVLEFIDAGDIILTLFPSDAATDSEAGTLTWAVPGQPWQDGDSLTFRIRAQRLPDDPAGP